MLVQSWTAMLLVSPYAAVSVSVLRQWSNNHNVTTANALATAEVVCDRSRDPLGG